MQSDVPIDLSCSLKTLAMPNKPKGCYLLSTIRIDSQDQRRITIKLRTSEGRNGNLSAIVLAYGEKTAIQLEIPIKALNLHTRL